MRITALSIVSLSLLLASCATSVIPIEVMKPAKTAIDTSIVSIGVANRVNTQNVVVPAYYNGEEIGNYQSAVELASEEAVKHLAKDLNEIGRFKAVAMKYKALPLNAKSIAVPTNLEAVCRAYRVQAVVALETFKAEVDVDSYTSYSAPVDVNQGTVRVPVFHNNQSVDLEVYWRLYTCEGARVLNEKSVASSSYYATEDENPYDAMAELPDGKMSLSQVAIRNAGFYMMEISPYWSTVKRTMYLYGNDDLYRAGKNAYNGDWDWATDIWFELTKHPLKSVAKKATYNMALASEVAGDYELAFSWLEKSITDYKDKRAMEYKAVLEKRMKEIELLNSQF